MKKISYCYDESCHLRRDAHAANESHLDIFKKKGFVETLSFQQIVKPVFGGGSAYPPEPPLRLAIVSYSLLWSYRSKGVPQRRGRRHFMP